MHPTNEAETIELFESVQDRLGWQIVELQQAFPDAVIENSEGTRLIAEFEYKAANFRIHGHDPSGCHIIICWQNNWAASPLPVWALKDWMPIVDSTWSGIADWRPDSIPIRYGHYRQLQARLKEIDERLEKTERELNRIKFESLCNQVVKRAGIFDIRSVGQFYTESGRDYRRLSEFFHEIFLTQSVIDIHDKWVRRNEIMQHLIIHSWVVGNLTEMIDALSHEHQKRGRI